MAKTLHVFKDFDLEVIYAPKDAKQGDPAVKFEYGFRTGSTPGIHSTTGCEAEFELGILDDDLEFESIEERKEGLDVPVDKHGEVDWDAVDNLVNQFFDEWQ